MMPKVSVIVEVTRSLNIGLVCISVVLRMVNGYVVCSVGWLLVVVVLLL